MSGGVCYYGTVPAPDSPNAADANVAPRLAICKACPNYRGSDSPGTVWCAVGEVPCCGMSPYTPGTVDLARGRCNAGKWVASSAR